uniref:Uncharacterized protein n=1 Tax=Gallus gallus TaxID=9031 RepID=A0A8V0YTS1_CHICK
MYWWLSVMGSVGLGGRGGWLRASSASHGTSTSLYSSMAVRASSTDECPFRCLARLLSEALAPGGSPALWLSSGIRLVSRVFSLGWKYFRAWKSLWMACPTTILSFRIFRIWKSQRAAAHDAVRGGGWGHGEPQLGDLPAAWCHTAEPTRGSLSAQPTAGSQQPPPLQQRPPLHEALVPAALLLAARTLRRHPGAGGPGGTVGALWGGRRGFGEQQRGHLAFSWRHVCGKHRAVSAPNPRHRASSLNILSDRLSRFQPHRPSHPPITAHPSKVLSAYCRAPTIPITHPQPPLPNPRPLPAPSPNPGPIPPSTPPHYPAQTPLPTAGRHSSHVSGPEAAAFTCPGKF